ncbi:MAG: ATP-binding protein [Selenomonadaceae bacterium]|nr:ATP-binding protein [Selenomonadaceae bacterium]
MTSYRKTNDLVNKKFLMLFMPTLLSSVSLYAGTILSGILVGNLVSPEAMASIYACIPLNQFVVSIALLISVGAAGMVSIASGKNDIEQANYIFSNILILSFIFALLTIFLLYPFIPEIAEILSSAEELHKNIERYLSIFIIRTAMLIVITVWRYLIRIEGLAKIISVSSIISQVLNILLTIFLVGFLSLGVVGAGVALLISDFVGGLYMFTHYNLTKERNLKFINIFKFGMKKFFAQTIQILKSGVPAATVTILAGLKVWIIFRILGDIGGANAVIFYSICITGISVMGVLVNSCCDSSMAIVGMLYGEKDFLSIRMMLKFIQKFSFTLAGTFVGLVCIFPEVVLHVYNLPNDAIESGVVALRIFAPSLLGTAFVVIMANYYSTIQRRNVATILSFVEGILVVVPAALILSQFFGVNGVWASFILAEVAGFISVLVYTKKFYGKKKIKLGDILLIDETDPRTFYDVSTKANEENAVKISAEAIEIIRGKNFPEKDAVKVGIALEEFIVNVKQLAKNKTPNVDVIIKLDENQNVMIVLRDDGKAFNPLEYKPNDEENVFTDGIVLMKALSKKIQYNRVVGLNQPRSES